MVFRNQTSRQLELFVALTLGFILRNLQHVSSMPEPVPFPTAPPLVVTRSSPPVLQPFQVPLPPFSEPNGCWGGDTKVKVEVQTDRFGNDTSFEIVDYYTGKKLLRQRGYTMQSFEYLSREICLPDGLYNFTISDEYGDGICCRYGKGFFRISFDDEVVLAGGSFNSNVSEVLNIGFQPKEGSVSQREFQYLESHNSRRKEWHERYNVSYVPMKYSPALAKTAKAWAEELLNACGVAGIEHEDFNPFGENLAKNVGNRSTFGQLYPVDNIVRRWVEFEVGLPYPSNGHLTQVLWRASTYLGCGEASKEYRGVCVVFKFVDTEGEFDNVRFA
ncbi:hypothetical protein HJC23_002062 [Cyclotella cryptica]|uniref:SCP domain-containing protein n=1 Tax=Cyclotella cryptica TaxID=29204 RepID=A0ABD3Q6A7_9STRA